jgi:hypothetical protein
MIETPAVTQTDSAPSTPISLADLTPEQRQDWRKTGEFPAAATEKKETKQDPPSKEDSATSQEEKDAAKSVTAAESDAASKQAGKPNAEQRKAELNNEIRDLIRKRDELKRETSGTRDGKQESQAAPEVKTPPEKKAEATPKPQRTDKDDKGQWKFKTEEEFQDAREEWLRAELKRELAETSKQTAQEQEQQRAREVIQREQTKRVEAARKTYADFDDVALNPDLPLKAGSALDAFILDSPHGTDVLYHLGKNLAELERIQGKPVLNQDGSVKGFTGGLTPVRQVAEFTKIEAQFSKDDGGNSKSSGAEKSDPPAPPKTQAAKPPREVGGWGTQSEDPLYSAAEAKDFRSFKAESNRLALASLKR